MIIHTNPAIPVAIKQELIATTQALCPDANTLVTAAAIKDVPESFKPWIADSWVFDTDIQLASRAYQNETIAINMGDDRVIGGHQQTTFVAAGPCSVESHEQLWTVAQSLKGLGVRYFRAGCFKPRTSPYSFQGLGSEGLQLLQQLRAEFGFSIITEVRDGSHCEEVIEATDIIQVGAKAMYDHAILRACGQSRKPVLLKRGFGSTLQEFVQAAEFIMSSGNQQVILCERGIRTFETKTRFTLDLCGVAYLKEHTRLPVVLDPSHAMGYRYGVPALTRACLAMGISGLLIEVHPNPSVAKSDASQQLDLEEFSSLYQTLPPLAQAVGYRLC